jgi:hypothetical protein
MGVLIKSALDPEASGEPVEEEAEALDRDAAERAAKGTPKLVPITHPREGKR